jgi:hypothetical protein
MPYVDSNSDEEIKRGFDEIIDFDDDSDNADAWYACKSEESKDEQSDDTDVWIEEDQNDIIFRGESVRTMT